MGMPELLSSEMLQPRVAHDELVAQLTAVLPPASLLHEREDLKPFECDGMTAYQRVPLMCDLGKSKFCNDITYEELISSVKVWKELCSKRTNGVKYASEPAAPATVNGTHANGARADGHRAFTTGAAAAPILEEG